MEWLNYHLDCVRKNADALLTYSCILPILPESEVNWNSSKYGVNFFTKITKKTIIILKKISKSQFQNVKKSDHLRFS